MDASIRSRSALLTIAILAGIFLILYYTYLRTRIPPFPEANGGGGVLISIGTLDDAFGEVQPMSEEIKETPAPVVKSTPVYEEEIATQDVGEAPVVKINKEVKKTEPKKNPVVAKPVQRKPDQASLYKGSTTSKSQGNTTGAGDQGERNGGPVGYTGKSGNGTGGSGGGSGDSDGPGSGSGAPGISFSLAGRNMIRKPSIDDNSQETGKVVVEITVNNTGDVTYANPGARGTTTSSSLLFKLAKDAAMQAKFSKSDGADIQRGTITFVFVVQ